MSLEKARQSSGFFYFCVFATLIMSLGKLSLYEFLVISLGCIGSLCSGNLFLVIASLDEAKNGLAEIC